VRIGIPALRDPRTSVPGPIGRAAMLSHFFGAYILDEPSEIG
jgi:hypothetical protein